MEKLANKIAKWLQANLDLDQDKTEVVEYSLISLFLLVVTFSFLIFFCAIFGVIQEGLIGALTIALLRMATGGAHLTSPWRCAIFSALLPAGFGYISLHYSALFSNVVLVCLFIFVFIWGLYIIIRYAPVDSQEKPIRPERRGVYRRIGVGITLIWAILVIICFVMKIKSYFLASLLGFAWQILTLTPLGFLIYNKLSRFGIKEEKG